MKTSYPVVKQKLVRDTRPLGGRDPFEEYQKNMDRLNFESARFWYMQMTGASMQEQYALLSSNNGGELIPCVRRKRSVNPRD